MNNCWVSIVCKVTESCPFVLILYLLRNACVLMKQKTTDLFNSLFPNNKNVEPSVIWESSGGFSCCLSYLIWKHCHDLAKGCISAHFVKEEMKPRMAWTWSASHNYVGLPGGSSDFHFPSDVIVFLKWCSWGLVEEYNFFWPKFSYWEP